jgi:hypothetical protein
MRKMGLKRPIGFLRLIFFSMGVLAYASNGVKAQCPSGEILVGEDQNNYYCKTQREFSECIKNAGLQSRTDRKNCAYQVQGVFADAGDALSTSALQCMLGSLGNGLTPQGTLSSCGLASFYPAHVLQDAVDKMNGCFERILISQKQREAICRR